MCVSRPLLVFVLLLKMFSDIWTQLTTCSHVFSVIYKRFQVDLYYSVITPATVLENKIKVILSLDYGSFGS